MLQCIHKEDSKYYHDSIITSELDILIIIEWLQE